MSLRRFLVTFLFVLVTGFLIFFKETIFGKLEWMNYDTHTSLLIHKLEHAPVISLDEMNITQIEISQESCHFFNCFNIYRCVDHSGRQKNIHVHIPSPKKFVTNRDDDTIDVAPLSYEFVEMLEAITDSQYYTADPEKACIFVPVFNVLNQLKLPNVSIASNAVQLSSPFWDVLNGGENHLLFSFYTPSSMFQTSPQFRTGRAVMAAAGLSKETYRRGFDVSLPAYSPLQKYMPTNSTYLVVKARRLTLLSTQIRCNENLRNVFRQFKMNYTNKFERLSNCVAVKDSYDRLCKLDDESTSLYSDVLADAEFCLVTSSGVSLSTTTLMEALHFSCIPVIAVDSLVLPFSDVIDWKRFSIRIYEDDIPRVMSIVEGVSVQRRLHLRYHGSQIYDRYFSSLRKITTTTLDILNDRIFSHHAKNYLDWNVFPSVRRPLFLHRTEPASEGFTAVVLTHNRLDSLYAVISSISEAPSLRLVIVVWNNQEKSPPAIDSFPKISKPLKVIRTKGNKLSNRFMPFPEIETAAVLSIDDDISMLTADELEFGFQVWREFPDRLVGFPSRTHVWDNASSQWRYESEWTSELSLVLTGAAFYHKYWHHVFSDPHLKEAQIIREWVDKKMNCEDLAMNFLIANMTGNPPIKVTPRKKFKCSTLQCDNVDMLSAASTHLVERTACLNKLVDAFGYLPLKSVEFRADPVLFRDNLPKKLKRFANIGSL